MGRRHSSCRARQLGMAILGRAVLDLVASIYPAVAGERVAPHGLSYQANVVCRGTIITLPAKLIGAGEYFNTTLNTWLRPRR